MTDLIQKIERFVKESETPVRAEDLAVRFLKLTSPAGAESLIRRLLAPSPVLEEVTPGAWTCLAVARESWLPRLLLEVEAPAGGEADPSVWIVAAGVVDEPASPPAWIVGEGGTGEGGPPEGPGPRLDRALLEALDRHAMASTRPARVRRWLDFMERTQAVTPEFEEVLDLRELLIWRLAQGGRPRPEPGTLRTPWLWPGLFGAAGPVAEGVLGAVEAGSALLRDCQEAGADPSGFRSYLDGGGSAGEPVDFSPFEFSRGDLARIPEVPGIYRFSDGAGGCLYIGKAKNLRRRIGQYFNPFGDRSGRRRAFLREVRGLRWQSLPTELAALLSESASIRRVRPRWNVQIEIHPEPGHPGKPGAAPGGGGDSAAGAGGPAGGTRGPAAGTPPGSRRGTALIAVPSVLIPEQSELYLLGAEGAARGRKPHDPADPPQVQELAAGLARFVRDGRESPLFEILDPPEAILAHRWYGRRRDSLFEAPLEQFSSFEAAAKAVLGALRTADGGGSTEEGPGAGRPDGGGIRVREGPPDSVS